MVFTTSSLQQAAYNYAETTRMAVIRILDDDSRVCLIERTTKHLTTSQSNSITINVHTVLTNKYYLSIKQDTFGSFGNNEFTSVQEIFSAVIKSIKLEVEKQTLTLKPKDWFGTSILVGRLDSNQKSMKLNRFYITVKMRIIVAY